METYSNISFPSKVRFRKKVHSQTSDHVWFFLNLFSKRPREKKRNTQMIAAGDRKSGDFLSPEIYSVIGISGDRKFGDFLPPEI